MNFITIISALYIDFEVNKIFNFQFNDVTNVTKLTMVL
jgi:hypothetical protein